MLKGYSSLLKKRFYNLLGCFVKNNIIFGPLNSRRFGLSLGVDLSPNEKSCNFDCLYCELSVAPLSDTIQNPPTTQEIIQALNEAIATHPDIDVITLTANGEPTLYPQLKELVTEINRIKEDKRLLILSNGSTINNPNIVNALLEIDIVKLSLDCATPRCFQKLDRPLKSIDLEAIIRGMKAFRTRYTGDLIIEILIVKGINDTIEEMQKLNEVLQDIQPDRIDLGTIERPPAYSVEGVSEKRMRELSSAFKNLPIHVVHQHPPKTKIDFDEGELLNLITMRPQSQNDVKALFSPKSKTSLEKLIQKDRVVTTKIAGVTFYQSTETKQKRKEH